MINEIYLRRKNKIILEKSNGNRNNNPHVATILKNLESLGYSLSLEIIDILNTFRIDELEIFYTEIVQQLKNIVGISVSYKPMYPNFPMHVLDARESELYINAIIHYWSAGKLNPVYEKKERLPFTDITKLKVINLGTKEEFEAIFTNLLQSKTSISETDRRDICSFVGAYKDKIIDLLPKEIPLKENVAFISKLILKETSLGENTIGNYYKTATDVLRLAAALSDGDISLAKNTWFKSFSRKERRILLSLLDNCNNIEEDMTKYKNRWIRLGERLHPSEFKASYPKAQQAFRKLRNNEKIETFYGKVNMALEVKDFSAALQLLKHRPGELARKLDYLLRTCPSPDLVVKAFEDTSKGISTPVLLQVMAHFKNRNIESKIRTFFPKGSIAKVYGIANNLMTIDYSWCEQVVKICEQSLIEVFKSKEDLNKVYIDENLRNFLVPFSQRSASKALKTLVRGSRIDIPKNATTIRSFVYWKESRLGRADLDLSAVMYDKDWNYKEHISYTNLRSNRYKSCHSGDIISAPDGASEFIDLDIDSIRKYGGRFVVMSINSFTLQPFVDLPACFMGWMPRQYPNSGEIYEPRAIANKIDITADTKICIPFILDLQDNKIIWTDIALKSSPVWYNNVEGNQRGMTLMGKAFENLVKPNLYDLFKLHAKARGQICYSKEEANTIFSLEEGITPFETDVIVSQYL